MFRAQRLCIHVYVQMIRLVDKPCEISKCKSLELVLRDYNANVSFFPRSVAFVRFFHAHRTVVLAYMCNHPTEGWSLIVLFMVNLCWPSPALLVGIFVSISKSAVIPLLPFISNLQSSTFSLQQSKVPFSTFNACFM